MNTAALRVQLCRLVRMRITFLSLIVLVFAGLTGAQVSNVFISNNVARADAIKAASELKLAMREEDAAKVLIRHGLTNGIAIGAVVGWRRYYYLSDGSSLALDYAARKVATNGLWGGNGSLQKAVIISNGVTVASFALTNAP